MKIAIVGSSSSGKSTLAEFLSKRLGVHWIELDSLFHLPNWQQESTDAFREKLRISMDRSIKESSGWVVDGNYSSRVGDLVLDEADVILYFNLPKRVVLYRVIKRSIKRLVMRQVLWNDNRERLRNLLSFSPQENVVLWSLTTHDRRKTQLSRLASSALPNQLWIEVHQKTEYVKIVEQIKQYTTLQSNT